MLWTPCLAKEIEYENTLLIGRHQQNLLRFSFLLIESWSNCNEKFCLVDEHLSTLSQRPALSARMVGICLRVVWTKKFAYSPQQEQQKSLKIVCCPDTSSKLTHSYLWVRVHESLPKGLHGYAFLATHLVKCNGMLHGPKNRKSSHGNASCLGRLGHLLLNGLCHGLEICNLGPGEWRTFWMNVAFLLASTLFKF